MLYWISHCDFMHLRQVFRTKVNNVAYTLPLIFSYRIYGNVVHKVKKLKARSAKPKRIHLFHRVNRLQASRALFHSSVFRHHQAFWRLCIIVSLFLDWQSPWACISLQQHRTTIDCPKIVITNTTALPPWNLALPWPTDQWSFFRLQKYPFKLWLML